ncbi:hypothetical protein FRY98_02375 [Paenibacillus faecis]|uniref:Uncharacterized protein n=1 Tax=Paenibacillus faecis TaxID=862114 RepID=A0A5D0CZ27_9BACL|nr:hypothetical protein [Paenibacillus faecis]TYA14554.1 hypothetical protein FRY98_02375 [Paenibacillus faecis]
MSVPMSTTPNTLAVCIIVLRMPEAAPMWFGPTRDRMAVSNGAPTIPWPIPARKSEGKCVHCGFSTSKHHHRRTGGKQPGPPSLNAARREHRSEKKSDADG